MGRSNVCSKTRTDNKPEDTDIYDARNYLYLSERKQDLLRFYDSFASASDLVAWMRNRPRGESNILRVSGENDDIVVVIPTMSVNNNFAKTCLKIFKGFELIFVESGVGNRYFNFAHNCNVGFRYVLDNLNPSWIVYSNDDMYSIDSPKTLENELGNIRGEPSIVFAGLNSHYHSYVSRFLQPSYAHYLMSRIIGGSMRVSVDLQRKFGIDYLPVWDGKVDLKTKLSRKILQRKIASVINSGSFGIFNYGYVRKVSGNVYDDTFITGLEDIDLSIRAAKEGIAYSFINYQIGDRVGQSSPSGISRYLKNMANYAYLNAKHPLKSISGLQMSFNS